AFDVAAVALAPPGPGEIALHLHASYPTSPNALASVRARCLAELARRGSRAIIEPTHVGQSGFPVEPGPEQPIRSELALPIVIDDKLAGLAMLASFTPGVFEPDDQEIAEQVVVQAAEAARRLSSRLHDERRKMALMVESMVDGVIMTDEKSEVFLIN